MAGGDLLHRTGLCQIVHQRIASPGEINYPMVDPFTLVHAAVGVLLSTIGLGLLPTVIIAAVWEVAEHLLKNCTPQFFVFPSQDTLRNAIGDIAATAAGWFLIRWAKESPPKERTREAQEEEEAAAAPTDVDPTPA